MIDPRACDHPSAVLAHRFGPARAHSGLEERRIEMAQENKTKATPESNGSNAAVTDAPATNPAAAPQGQPSLQAQPSMKVLGQYLKDLSFENPNAPASMTLQAQPDINISVNVNAKPLGQGGSDYEVELHLDAKASHQGKVIFATDLLYAGVFRLENIPKDALHPIVLIECPRMLFP